MLEISNRNFRQVMMKAIHFKFIKIVLILFSVLAASNACENIKQDYYKSSFEKKRREKDRNEWCENYPICLKMALEQKDYNPVESNRGVLTGKTCYDTYLTPEQQFRCIATVNLFTYMCMKLVTDPRLPVDEVDSYNCGDYYKENLP